MHADAHYVIGAGHLVCQDYAVAGTFDGGAYAIVADGCSGAAGSDVGARLVALAAEHAVVAAAGELSPVAIIERARAAAELLGLAPRCLDATLMWAVARGDEVEVMVSGDGVIAAMREDGLLESWSIGFDRGAPAYLGYWLDEARMSELVAMDQTRRVEHVGPAGTDETLAAVARTPYLFRLTLDARRHPRIALFSDGVTSVTDSAGEPVELARVLAELFDFKTATGQFVTRRLRRFAQRECPVRGWSQRDDLAAAVLCAAGAA